MKKALLAAGLLACGWATAVHAAPEVKECIAPAKPGGGWDFTCRTVAKIMQQLKLADGSVRTVNIPGAGGGIGYSHVVTKRNDDTSVFVAASTATTTLLGENKFPGLDRDMVRWVGSLGADYGVLAVGENSPYHSLKELVSALQNNPDGISFAGGDARGGWDNLKSILFAKVAGVKEYKKLKYIPFDGGGEALTQVLGNHVDVFAGDFSEIKGYIGSNQLRILAVLSENKLPEPFDKIPIAKDEGVDFQAVNWRGIYVPKGISDADYQWWTKALDTIYNSPEWTSSMEQNGLMPFYNVGPSFKDYVYKQIDDIRGIAQEIGLYNEQ